MEQLDWLTSVERGEPLPGGAPALDAEGRAALSDRRYVDLGLIASGGMASVRVARDRAIRREVAVKLLHPTFAKQPVHVQRFVEEALVTGQLAHPNIIPLHDLGRDERGSVYFTMPRASSRTLHDVLRSPAHPPGSSRRLEVALEIFLKVCDAVAFAHSRGVIHRDLKPANVLVGEHGQVQLVDWGLAKVLHARGVEIPRSPDSPVARMREGASGTPAYLAPEQLELPPRADERTDIFGLGAVLYEIVAGRPPYVGSQDEVLAQARRCAPTPVERGRPYFVPQRLARAVARAIAADPDARFQRVDELAAEVRGVLRLGMHLPLETFGPGDAIVREGEVGDRAFILAKGECEVWKQVGDTRRLLRRMFPGAVFGETAVFGDARRSATVTAASEVSVVVIGRRDLDERLATDSWEGMLVRALAGRFRELDAKLHGAEPTSGLTDGAGTDSMTGG